MFLWASPNLIREARNVSAVLLRSPLEFSPWLEFSDLLLQPPAFFSIPGLNQLLFQRFYFSPAALASVKLAILFSQWHFLRCISFLIPYKSTLVKQLAGLHIIQMKHFENFSISIYPGRGPVSILSF